MIALLGLVLGLNTASAQNCTPVSSQDLDMQIDSVAMGFLEFDWDKIEKGLASIESKVPCLTESIDPTVANDYHMLSGLYLYYKSQMDDNADGKQQAENSLRLAKRLAPDKTIPKHIFNDGHEIHEIYAGLEYIELDSDIPTSSRGVYIFNGQTINRPANTKTIVQIKEGNSILLSAITGAGESLPVISANAATAQTTAPAQNTPSKTQTQTTPVTTNDTAEVSKSKPSNGVAPWLWTGGVVLAAGGSLATTNYVCVDFQIYCTDAKPQFETKSELVPLQGINYGLLGLGAFSAYKMQQAFRSNKSSAE